MNLLYRNFASFEKRVFSEKIHFFRNLTSTENTLLLKRNGTYSEEPSLFRKTLLLERNFGSSEKSRFFKKS